MLTLKQYKVLDKFRIHASEWLLAESSEERSIIGVLLGLKAIHGEGRIRVLELGKPYVAEDRGPELFHYNSVVGDALLQEFEDKAAKDAEQKEEEAVEKRMAARERRFDRILHVLVPFATLIIGWILGGFTPQHVYKVILGVIK